MCAINGFNFSAKSGFASGEKDEDLIHKMNQITKHRGPDRSGVFFGDDISLGHNRLSIIDLSERAAQPMAGFDGNEIIVFNGEIYNYKELKNKLTIYPFKTESDTEVIIAAYKKWGDECVKNFNGIFAFAIWNKEKKELFLARDHIGVKPLYYYWDGNKFIFSSEIKAILAHDISREIDVESLNHYLRLSYVPEPFTIFKGINKLLAGHTLVLKDNFLKIEKYWEIKDRENFKDKEKTKEAIRNILEDSVKHQVISDRPVGVFLSGGVDSSAVLGLTRKFSSSITKTYTTGFAVDIQKEKYNADLESARITAKYYGTEHSELIIKNKDVTDNLGKIVWHLDEPNGNHTAPAMFLLSKFAKNEVSVVLGGDGGDELFGGYDRYRLSKIVSMYNKMPYVMKSAVKLFLKSAGKSGYIGKLESAPGFPRFSQFMFQKEKIIERIMNKEIYNSETTKNYFSAIFSTYDADLQNNDFEKIFMDVDRLSWLTNDSLIRTDKMSMAHGLEIRVPILDYRLTELSQKIPTSWKIKRGEGKVIFKEAFHEYYLPHLKHKQKMGWFTPMSKWLREEPLKSYAEEVLNSLPQTFFNKENIMEIWRAHLLGKAYNLNILWYLVSFGIWYDFFIKRNH